jgi:hypothetical protein
MFTLILAIWFLAMNWLEGSIETYDQFLSRLTRECNNACTSLCLFFKARVMRKTVFNVRNLSGTFASGSKSALVKAQRAKPMQEDVCQLQVCL